MGDITSGLVVNKTSSLLALEQITVKTLEEVARIFNDLETLSNIFKRFLPVYFSVIFMSERTEALLRVFVWIISGIILEIWRILIQVVVVIHWIYVVLIGEKNKGMAEFCNIWNTQRYNYHRYLTFTTNKRPFPFGPMGNVRDKVE